MTGEPGPRSALMTTRDVARALGIHPATVRRYVKDGLYGVKLRAGQVGRIGRYAAADVAEFMAAVSAAMGSEPAAVPVFATLTTTPATAATSVTPLELPAVNAGPVPARLAQAPTPTPARLAPAAGCVFTDAASLAYLELIGVTGPANANATKRRRGRPPKRLTEGT